MHLLLLSAGTQVSAAFTPELVFPLGAALCCVDTSAQVCSLCLPAISGQQVPRSGRALESVGPFLSVLCFCLCWMRDCAIARPKYTVCCIFIYACLLTGCIKPFIRKATCVEQRAQQNTQCLCAAAPLVFSLQVQLWESSARDHAGDFVPEGKEASSKCQQGHL